MLMWYVNLFLKEGTLCLCTCEDEFALDGVDAVGFLAVRHADAKLGEHMSGLAAAALSQVFGPHLDSLEGHGTEDLVA